jgi:hypothetical protein
VPAEQSAPADEAQRVDLDLTVLGRVYDVSLETLGLGGYVPIPGGRDEVQHRRAVRKEDVNERDATAAR